MMESSQTMLTLKMVRIKDLEVPEIQVSLLILNWSTYSNSATIWRKSTRSQRNIRITSWCNLQSWVVPRNRRLWFLTWMKLWLPQSSQTSCPRTSLKISVSHSQALISMLDLGHILAIPWKSWRKCTSSSPGQLVFKNTQTQFWIESTQTILFSRRDCTEILASNVSNSSLRT